MASSANGNVKITTEIETAGLQESLNRLETIFNSFANNLKETARKTGDDVAQNLTSVEKTSKVFDNMSKAGEKVGKTFKAIGVAAVGLAGSFAGIVKSAISTADRVDELSKRLGITAESFSRLDYVASQSGTSVEAFGTAMRMIAQNINTGSDAYEKLGVSVRDTNGQLKTQDQILLETIKALQRMPAGTQKSAMALKALGRQSMQLNEILNMTSDEFDALMKRSDELGLTLTESITQPAQQIADKFTDLGKTFKMSLVNSITPMIPTLEKITDKFIAMLQPGGELAEAFKNIAQAGLVLIENVLPALIKALAWIVQNGPAVIAVFTAIKVTLMALTGNWIGAIATGLLGIFSATLLNRAMQTKESIDGVTASLKQLGVETSRQGGMSGIVQVSGTMSEMTAKLETAKSELAEFEKELAGLPFDTTINSTKELADKEIELKNKILTARTEVDKYTKSIHDLKERQGGSDGIVETTEASADSFDKWTQAVEKAEGALKSFIAEKSKLNGGFDIKALSAEDFIKYKELKANLAQAKEAINSMNNALQDTDSFDKWTRAVEDAENALKEFVATKAEGTGAFDISKLTEDEQVQFEKLRDAVKQAKTELQTLQDATKDSTSNMESDLADVANVIAQAWGAVGSAFGNGIESVAQVIASGTGTLSDVMGSLADTMAGALSAVGDALIQSGIAKMVAENLAKANMSSAAAIALGMSIKLAAGALKGFLQRIGNAGNFANGGIIGGNSFSGDNMTANVNSGEMIINRKQQAALWDFIRNGSNGGGSPNIEIVNNAGVDIQTESNTNGRALRIMVNNQIERFLGSPAGGRVMRNTYGARQLGRR